MNIQYRGLIISFLSDSEIIKIEGSVIEINTFLQRNIAVANFAQPSKINIGI